MRRTWAPVGRDNRTGSAGTSDETSRSHEGTVSDPVDTRQPTDDPVNPDGPPPDPWAEWLSSNPHPYGAPPLRSTSTGWNDSDWWGQVHGHGSSQQSSGWDDRGWDHGRQAALGTPLQ